MIVIVDELGYVVPASIVQALRRTFNTKYAMTNGESMSAARAFARDRLREKVRYQHFRAGVEPLEWPSGVALPPDVPPRARREFVADVLAERLVRQWLREGYLEVVKRGRYRRAR